ncbi:MAG: glycine--tRNA ligase subunit beta [Neisseria sp.]|nr:glycine--tRNA ligase subunit beta [Neisseria sp.]
MVKTLLIELLTEELPPKALNLLGNTFAEQVALGLQAADLTDAADDFSAYATPRRLAVAVRDVRAVQPQRTVTKKGPSVAAGMKDGVPTKALEGFARSCGVDIAALETLHDGKQEVFAYTSTQEGQPLEALLGEILAQAVKKLPIPKVMRWGSSTHQFVRPVHALSVLHGEAIVPVSLLGLDAGNRTRGHRFLSQGEIVLRHADDYAAQLRDEGKVVVSFAERKALIEQGLNQAAGKLQASIAADDALLDEVTALVEYPVVLEAGFDEAFLRVPQECLILTMQQNQKYFPLLNPSGKLMNRFLLVSNMAADDGGKQIIHGNEKVLRARLADAEFFYTQDQKQRLDSRLPKLAQVVYHNKIGSQAERVARLVAIAAALAQDLSADAALVERAALLAKADLLTEMVGEFPELQGTMGRYYALLDGENETVATAIEQHYRPRFAGDALPENAVATAVALADKLETLVGIWGIGLKPTGDKDPFALRRAALGVVRMLMRSPISLPKAIQAACAAFPAGLLAENTAEEVCDFAYARLAVLLNADYPHDAVAAVLAQRPAYLADTEARLQAVLAFKRLPEAAVLAAANKRVQNLLKKADIGSGTVRQESLQEAAEQALFKETQALKPVMTAALQQQDFQAALNALASIKPAVDDFFAEVMVMAEDKTLRNNRLYLLHDLSEQLNAVADIGQLQ